MAIERNVTRRNRTRELIGLGAAGMLLTTTGCSDAFPSVDDRKAETVELTNGFSDDMKLFVLEESSSHSTRTVVDKNKAVFDFKKDDGSTTRLSVEDVTLSPINPYESFEPKWFYEVIVHKKSCLQADEAQEQCMLGEVDLIIESHRPYMYLSVRPLQTLRRLAMNPDNEVVSVRYNVIGGDLQAYIDQ
jgi:hypothetical protein